jgi:hypothetical protein
MIRPPLALRLAPWLVLLCACFESHGRTQEVRSEDCVLCHRADFDATSMPVHAAASVGFPTTCADCHRSLDWRPALAGLHPRPNTYTEPGPTGQPVNQTFLIDAGPHAEVRCLTCHDLDVVAPAVPPAQRRGFNTDCLQCHPDDAAHQDAHRGAISATGGPYTGYRAEVRNFCLACHPTGDAVNHPKDKFPLTGGHAAPCTSCHVRTMGPDRDGLNTTCLGGGCHSLSKMDAEHDEARYRTYRGAPPAPLTTSNFCRAGTCHPDGRKHD